MLYSATNIYMSSSYIHTEKMESSLFTCSKDEGLKVKFDSFDATEYSDRRRIYGTKLNTRPLEFIIKILDIIMKNLSSRNV